MDYFFHCFTFFRLHLLVNKLAFVGAAIRSVSFTYILHILVLKVFSLTNLLRILILNQKREVENDSNVFLVCRSFENRRNSYTLEYCGNRFKRPR